MGQVKNIGNRLILKFRSNSFGFVEIFSRLINWGCLPLVSLLIAPDVFGQIVLLYSYILIITVLGGFGQQRSILMYGAKDDTAFYSACNLTVIAALFIFFSAMLLFNISIFLLPVIILNVLLNNLVSLSRAKENFIEFAKFRIGASLLRFLFVLVLLMIEPSIESYIFAEFISVSTIIILGLIKSTLNLKFNCFKLKRKNLIFYFSFGLPLFLQAGMTQILQIGDRFIIANSLGEVTLASYFFVSIFCSSVAFVFAFNAQKYEVTIYRSENLFFARKNTKAFLKKCLIHAFYFYFISLLLYFLSTLLSKNYSFDFLLMTALYLHFSSNVIFLSLTFLLTYRLLNKIILFISIFSALLFLIVVYIFIRHIGLYSIPLAGLLVSAVTSLILMYNMKR